MWGTYLLSWAA